MKAVVLLSGGLDSATVLAVAKNDGRDCYTLSFAYGQRHSIELEAARRVAASLGIVEHVVFPMDLRLFGGSALTGDIDVPKDAAGAPGIPVTYVPARNTIFLSLALGYAEARDAREIWIGVNAVDFSGYPDCRPEFLDAFQRVIVTGTRSGVEHGEPRLIAPLVTMSKADIVRRGVALGVDYSLTHSCYDPDARGLACGHCDSCILRKRGFEEAGVADPTRYQHQLYPERL
ncbi:MAG TPA: 7-cyano-7-deazaguanine synthase QueC [Thermoanaerobaculia bacterium]|jgi:7-cyano-7-deazaguanine synthase|nr:7-cyano-7-deazaguanine synthase QueC [Thermoanaerobaculia bacterium]